MITFCFLGFILGFESSCFWGFMMDDEQVRCEEIETGVSGEIEMELAVLFSLCVCRGGCLGVI